MITSDADGTIKAIKFFLFNTLLYISMVIKNKDGTVYKISGPNPLMDQQDFWNDFQKHNFDWLPDIVKDGSFKILKNDLKEIEIEFKEQPEKKSVETEQKPLENKPQNNIKKYNSISCYCLPAKIKEKKDDLYNETYQRTEYLDKTTIEIVIIEKEDLYIKIWCNDQLSEKSILYPKNKDKRWWKISEISNAPIGYYYFGHPSDYTPSFE